MGGANCPETPRQKMIGMMYLVLTALLALNVSKDILHAFVIVDEGLRRTKEGVVTNNNKMYGEFAKQYGISPAKVEKYYKKAMDVQAETKKIVALIEDIKCKTIGWSEFGDSTMKDIPADRLAKIKEEHDKLGIKMEKEYKKLSELPLEFVDGKDNYDKPMVVLLGLGDKGDAGQAKVLKGAIERYEKKLLSVLDEKVLKDLDKDYLGLDVKDSYNSGVKKEMSWGYNNFFHTVLAADVVLLNKMIADVKNAEAKIINILMASISRDDFKFDQIKARVIPKSNYVIKGEEYTADIFVAAYSSTEAPNAFVRTGADTITDESQGSQIKDVVDGVVKYKAGTGSLGEQKYAGMLILRKPDGTNARYNFKSSYIVAQPTAIVAATKMNVFYIGVDNPVSISVPGVPDTKIKPNISSGCTLSKTGKGGEYVVKCGNGVSKAGISVSADMGGGKARPMGTSDFRVKRVPDPVPYIGGVKGGPIAKAVLMAGGAIIPKMENFDFDLNFVIKSFTFTANVAGDLIEKPGSGNVLTAEMKKLIQAGNKGQKIFIEDIKAQGPDGSTRTLSPINLKLL